MATHQDAPVLERVALLLPVIAVISCGGSDPVQDEDDTPCEPNLGMMCTCPDGTVSVQWCKPDGSGYLPCECEAGDEGFGETADGSGEVGTSGDGQDSFATLDDSSGDGGDGDGDETGTEDGGDGDGDMPSLCQTCYPGPNEDNSVCFELTMPTPLPAGYDYPGPYQGNTNYREPVCYLDLESIDATAQVAPNFTMDEFVQAYKGRYAVLSPGAVAKVQDLRDIVGPIVVNSGYRPPGYNAMIGGATHSRHMYGDAFDLDPVDVSLATLESACTANDGFLVEYESHVHCDWRNVAVPEEFFGAPFVSPPVELPNLQANIELDEQGRFTAPASGFDEGEPLRRWSAYDAEGRRLVEARGRTFNAPRDSARVEVIVGARVRLRHDLR